MLLHTSPVKHVLYSIVYISGPTGLVVKVCLKFVVAESLRVELVLKFADWSASAGVCPRHFTAVQNYGVPFDPWGIFLIRLGRLTGPVVRVLASGSEGSRFESGTVHGYL